MDNKRDNIKVKSNSKGTNPYEIILDTYNSHKYPVIENQQNALVFPWSMQKDVDAIDTMKFSEDITSLED